MKNSDLVTIRTAYRYVVAYERRVRDALRLLNEALAGIDFNFWAWSPALEFAEVPQARRMPQPDTFVGGRSAWDNVPFYLSYHWWFRGVDEEDNRAGNAWMWVEHVADTGFEAALGRRRESADGEPDALEGLRPADDTDSLLRVRWALVQSPLPAEQWEMYWPQLVEHRFACKASEVFPLEPTGAPLMKRDGCLAAGGHVISLGDLRGPADVDRVLIDPVVHALPGRSQV